MSLVCCQQSAGLEWPSTSAVGPAGWREAARPAVQSGPHTVEPVAGSSHLAPGMAPASAAWVGPDKELDDGKPMVGSLCAAVAPLVAAADRELPEGVDEVVGVELAGELAADGT